MSFPHELPDELFELFADADCGDRALSVPLPPGRLVRGDEGDDEMPAMWVSAQPVTAGLWPRLRAEHQRSGLWPLLLDSLRNDERRPWDDGELWPADMSSPTDHDPGELLASWWTSHTDTDDDILSASEQVAVTAPYGQRWPGLAEAAQLLMDPDDHADRCAEDILRSNPGLRLGLVAAGRGGDAPTVAGWQGAANHTGDTAELSAVLRSWEDRFGVRVVGAGFAELHLSVAAPPSTATQAERVAAEHFAFCPDNIWQGASPYTLAAYAERLIDAPTWSFWWD